MKHHIGLTIDAKLLTEIERIRGREKRSTFIEHLVVLGLRAHNAESESMLLQETRRGRACQRPP